MVWIKVDKFTGMWRDRWEQASCGGEDVEVS